MSYEKPVLIDDNSVSPAGTGLVAANVYWMANVVTTVNGLAVLNVMAEYNVNVTTK